MKTSNRNSAPTFAQKWSQETGANGFTQVPNILLTCHGSLGLSYGELVTLVQLMSFWFEHQSEVYPSISRIAKRSNKGYSTTQRHLKSLDDKGFIKRKYVFGETNRYDLKPCAIKLHQHQKVCNVCIQVSQKRGVPTVKVSRLPHSETTEKEYYSKRTKDKTNRKKSNMSAISGLLENHRYRSLV